MQDILKLAKKFYDKGEKIKTLKKYSIIKNNNLLDEQMFKKIKNKRNSIIPIDEKLIDLLFITDCILVNEKNAKKSLQNYYILNIDKNPQIDLSYILNDYYSSLKKEADLIAKNIRTSSL